MTNLEMESVAHAKIVRARAHIMQNGRRKFWAVLLANTKPKACWSVPTMATDGRTHYYNPKFVLGMTDDELMGVVVHEAEHDARHHSTRRKNREAVRWNKACDYTINPDILAEGFKLPDIGVLNRADLAGISAEAIYRILEQEERQQQQEQQQQQQEQEETEDDQSGGDGESDDEPEDDEAEDDSEETGDDQSDADAEDDGDGETEGDGDDGETEQSDDTGGDGESSDQPGEDDGETEGDGDAADGEAGDGQPGDGDGQTEGDGKPGDPTSCGDGGMGEVLDAPGDEGKQADLDTKWEIIARQAAAMARKAGNLPGHWQLELEKRNTPTEDWRAVLREFFDAGASTFQTFSRPNKRFAWSGTILPGNQREGVNKVVFMLDTSYSMFNFLRNSLVANEVNAAMEAGVISEAIVIQCDTNITDVARYVNGDTVDLTVKGLGGTDMAPGFQWVEDNEPDANLIVCLTDLEIPDPGPEPQQNVIWCHYGSMEGPMAEYKHKPAWGRVLDVGSDV